VGTRLAKIGGILQETSTEELARQEGLPSAPTSPLGAAGIGASQDMAKMSGTGAQIRATIRETLKERTDVMDVMGEAERGASRGRFQVQQIQQQLQTLGGLGSLDNRVAELVRARITASEQPVAGLTNEVNAKALEDTIKLANPLLKDNDLKNAVDKAKEGFESLRTNTSQSGVVALLNSIGIEATINDDATTLAQKLAETGIYDQATAEDIKDAMDKIALDTKDIKVKDLQKDDLDFDKASAAAVLGLDVEDLDNMTLGEVKSQLAAYRSSTFTNIDELREVLDNPFSSQSQKDFARKRLAELGAVGVTSFEQKANNLQAQMEEGDTVKVGDKYIPVEQIMTDPTLRATIAAALDSPEELAKLAKSDSALADWVKKNAGALKDIKDELTAGLGDLAANLKEQKDYYADAPPDALDKLVPGWRNATDADLDKLKADQITNLKTVGQVLNGSLVEDDKGNDIPLSSDQRNMALTLLSRLGKDKAIAFPAAMLNSIVTTAGSETEAVDMLNAYTTTSEDKAWQGSINATVAFAFTPDQYYTQKIYDEEVAEIVGSFLSEFTSIQGVVDKINTLMKSTSPADRVQAIELAKQLANIKGEVNRKINKNTIDKKREEIKVEKQRTNYLGEKKPLEDAFTYITDQLAGRPDGHLKNRGSEVVQNLKSKLATLSMQAQEGSITFEQALAKAKELKAEMAGHLSAFADDKNHREKHPEAALDAVRMLLDSGLKENLNEADRKKLRDNIQLIIDRSTLMRLMTSASRYDAVINTANELLNRV